MDKEKGFTLIELLAVIVILAVIALIAVPVILSLVDKSRRKAAEESAILYVDTIENMLMINNIENTDGKTYKVRERMVVDEKDKVILNLEIKGDVPYSGVNNEIKINSGFIETANLRFNSYYVHYEMDMTTKKFKTCTSQKGFLDNCDGTGSVIPSTPDNPDEPKVDSGATIEVAKGKTYLAIIYLDPTDISKKCTKEEAEANLNEYGTPTIITSGCMKWYAYKEDDKNYTMILDHNTSGNVKWNNNRTTVDEPTIVMERLQDDIKEWEEVIRKKTRLIRADEVAEITGANREDTIKWHSSKTYINGNPTDTNIEVASFYFTGSGTSYKGNWDCPNTSNSPYAWLYDYTAYCVNNGCNVGDENAYPADTKDSTYSMQIEGYWTETHTITSTEFVVPFAYLIGRTGLLNAYGTTYNKIGVRPVITIPKNIFDKKEEKPEEDSKGILKDVVKLGDYISYTPISTSYTIRKEDTGY